MVPSPGDGRLLTLPGCGFDLSRLHVIAGAVQVLAVPPCDPAGSGQLDLVEAIDRLGQELSKLSALGSAEATASASARRSE